MFFFKVCILFNLKDILISDVFLYFRRGEFIYLVLQNHDYYPSSKNMQNSPQQKQTQKLLLKTKQKEPLNRTHKTFLKRTNSRLNIMFHEYNTSFSQKHNYII